MVSGSMGSPSATQQNNRLTAGLPTFHYYPYGVIPPHVEPVLRALAPLTQAFHDAGFQLYLVGGSVRDALLRRDLSGADVDLTTNARPDDIERVLKPFADSVWDQGRRFGTIGARMGPWTVEITTFRSDSYVDHSRKPEVDFGDDIETDLSRRDFTINAMALDLSELRLVDPFGGLDDLLAKRLRTPSGPEVSFSDDPLRMLRAARFVAGLDLVPEGELVRAAKALAPRLEIVSAERIRDELDKLMVVERPSPGLWFLVETGLADQFLPELPALRLEQDPIHRHKDVLAHTIAVVDKTRPQLVVRLAALFHDVGKPATRSYVRRAVTFHHHDVVGARMTRERMRELRYPTEMVSDVTSLVELHLRFHTYRLGWTDSAVRRYVRDAGPLLSELNELTRCDCTTRNPRKARELAQRMDQLEQRIGELQAQEQLDAMRPELDGRFVMEHLGIGPGRVVGDALKFLLAVRLDEGLLGEAEAIRRLDTWWAEQTQS